MEFKLRPIRTAVRIYRYFRHLVYGQWDFGVLRTQGIASLHGHLSKPIRNFQLIPPGETNILHNESPKNNYSYLHPGILARNTQFVIRNSSFVIE